MPFSYNQSQSRISPYHRLSYRSSRRITIGIDADQRCNIDQALVRQGGFRDLLARRLAAGVLAGGKPSSLYGTFP